MASNYHLGYKTNVVRTVSGQEVALSGTGGDSNNIEIDVVEDNVFNLPISLNPPDVTTGYFHSVQNIREINNAKVGERYLFMETIEDINKYMILEVTEVYNGQIMRAITFDIKNLSFYES